MDHLNTLYGGNEQSPCQRPKALTAVKQRELPSLCTAVRAFGR